MLDEDGEGMFTESLSRSFRVMVVELANTPRVAQETRPFLVFNGTSQTLY